LNVGEGEPRTMSLADLVVAYNAGAIAQDTFIWTDGMDDWKPLTDVEAVVAALHADAGAEAAPPSAHQVAPTAGHAAPAAPLPAFQSSAVAGGESMQPAYEA